MNLVDVKHAWFDQSVFPSLRAINPSANLALHSQLPDFSGVSALPFDSDDDDEDSTPDNDQLMASPAPSHHSSKDKDGHGTS
ncbi:hypothetical protein PCANC_21711 [Puccinia coronata f. sp. avenae]|uniref:Uncharacterized protein n=1 Tax=Puccinia coronata f. sp. avenae TaxID=200324 RepID=A0A2N5SDT6_9BASI|nr:hypothetical protein PCANC_21711 [Puccinia coronata f. sp. avenae]